MIKASHPSCNGCVFNIKFNNENCCYCLQFPVSEHKRCPFKQSYEKLESGLKLAFKHSGFLDYNDYIDMLCKQLNDNFYQRFKKNEDY